MINPLYKDKDWLYQKYVVEGLSLSQAAMLEGCNDNTIRNWLIKYEIPRRDGGFQKLPCKEANFNRLYHMYGYKAKGKKLEFSLTKEQFKYLTKQNCHYCGAESKQIFEFPHSNGAYAYNGIDRVDNNRGYIMENCVPCCGICNKAKNNTSYEDFLIWIQRVHARLRKI